MVLAFTLMMMVTSAQVCRSQDTSAATDKDGASQNQAQRRVDSSTQPSGRQRMFGIMPAYGLVEAGNATASAYLRPEV